MADPPTYPKRDRFFAYRLIRLLTKSCAAEEIGPLGCWFVTVIAMQEDACKYARPVNFWDSQLGPLLGIDSKASLSRLKRKVVSAGWLCYIPGRKGQIGKYWATIPSHADGLSDSPVDEDDADIRFHFETASETQTERKRNETETQVKRKQRPSLPISISISDSNSKDTHRGELENESTETVPSHPYVDWISAERDFLQFWGDSNNTCRVSYIPAEYMPAFQARWSDDEWRADAPRAIARLASSQFWSGRKVTLKQFLEPLFVNNLLSGGYEDANRTANAGAGAGRHAKPLPPHITAGKHGAPVNPNDPF